ncbi:MAG TPA: AfsR/SARP family transcriptional regulator [Iamia sp.]|nr:AfsR/SARP family transcriptional regulator [Iamia sp.]
MRTEDEVVTGIGLLGPVTASRTSGPVDLGGAQRRAVLARLALSVGRAVTADALVDGLWAEPPPTARKILQVQVSRLRAALPPGTVATAGGGYRLDVEPERVDAHRFEQAVAFARSATAPDRVVARLREADVLWRGPALADVGDVPFAAPAVARLEEARMEAVELRVGAALALGRGTELVAELEALVHEQPLRERLWSGLVIALHTGGRQADALRAYERARVNLADVGLSPGPDLRRAHDIALDVVAPTSPRTTSRCSPRCHRRSWTRTGAATVGRRDA